MEFYKVKGSANQTRINRPRKSWYLVANELISIKEAARENIASLLDEHAIKIEVKKTSTYWFFGCRFENQLEAK